VNIKYSLKLIINVDQEERVGLDIRLLLLLVLMEQQFIT
jgi:hypothetical protein